ncbi:MAG: oligopeptide transporter, OPT family [Myxococcales bacterium]|nr:oligopeptide transporter, OPT family [Myxococcales bacterium]
MSKPTTSTTRELTLRVIVLGVVLSVVMGAANVYLGLKAGMTVSASIPAAVVGMLILRGMFRNGTILEANQIQTAASAGESLAAGIIFTMPALLLIGVWKQFDFVLTTLIAFAGGLLGILFMIPMRRVFVLGDNDELTYPEGVACAAVLEAGDSKDGPTGALGIIIGALIGGAFKALGGLVGLFKGSLEGAMAVGDRIFFLGSDISPALVAVGFIVRLNVAVLIFIGGAMAWLIGIPMLGGTEELLKDPLEGAWTLWSTQIRYVGVGAMVVGGIASIIKVREGLVQAVREIRKGGNRGAEVAETERDIPLPAIIGLSLLASGVVGAVYYMLTNSVPIAALTTVIMIIMSFFFTAVASYIVGLVGNSNSPVSGMTITAVLFTGALLLIFGFSGTEGMVATLGVAAIVCCAACTSGDVCNDLKTGHMVGASPFRQQIMQVVGVAVAALVMAPVLDLLHNNTPGGIGGKELAAPQAALFANLAKGFFGDETLPWDLVAVGAVVGVAMVILDLILEKKKAPFRAHVMPIAVGMYLPFGLAPPILIGGLIAHFVIGDAKEAEADEKAHKGVPFSSGIIAGESLMGVGLALLASWGVTKLDLGFPDLLKTIATSAAAVVTLALFYLLSRSGRGEHGR